MQTERHMSTVRRHFPGQVIDSGKTNVSKIRFAFRTTISQNRPLLFFILSKKSIIL
jgi:hypothetical protein